MSDIAFYHKHNPDVMFAGCQVTQKNEDGISFPTVEPADGTVMFIGKTALIEAIAAYLKITPNQAKFRMEDRPSPKQAEFDELKKTLAKVEARLARWEKWKQEAEAAGLILTAFDE
jgi:hypothetical protein